MTTHAFSQPQLSIDFVVPCGRYDSQVAHETFKNLTEITANTSSRVFVVGKGVSQNRDLYPPSFNWINTDRLLWPGANRNLGARQSKADLIAFIDDDCTLETDILDTLQKIFLSHDKLTIVSGKIISAKRGFVPRSFDFAGFGYQQGALPIWDTPLLVSAFMCVNKAFFEQLDGFDEQLRIREDVDLVHRALEKKQNTLYHPDILVFHNHGRYTWKGFLKYMFNNGTWPHTMEEKAVLRSKKGHRRISYTAKLALKRFHFVLFPLFIVLNFCRLLKVCWSIKNEFFLHSFGILLGIGAYEVGRAVASTTMLKRETLDKQRTSK